MVSGAADFVEMAVSAADVEETTVLVCDEGAMTGKDLELPDAASVAACVEVGFVSVSKVSAASVDTPRASLVVGASDVSGVTLSGMLTTTAGVVLVVVPVSGSVVLSTSELLSVCAGPITSVVPSFSTTATTELYTLRYSYA